MKIQEQDIYHGPALMQIVEHPSFKALNRASNRYGHYLVNTDRQVFAKYRKTKRSPWQFVFAPDELAGLSNAIASGDRVFVCLVCGQVTICVLEATELQQVIDVDAGTQQSIRVEVPAGGSCHVRGNQWEAEAGGTSQFVSGQGIPMIEVTNTHFQRSAGFAACR